MHRVIRLQNMGGFECCENNFEATKFAERPLFCPVPPPQPHLHAAHPTPPTPPAAADALHCIPLLNQGCSSHASRGLDDDVIETLCVHCSQQRGRWHTTLASAFSGERQAQQVVYGGRVNGGHGRDRLVERLAHREDIVYLPSSRGTDTSALTSSGTIRKSSSPIHSP